MITPEIYKTALESDFWYDTQCRVTPDKVVVKLRHEDGTFVQSIILPTVMYPLTGNPEVFTARNTEPIEDSGILDILDTVPFRIGYCYTNTRNVLDALNKAGIPAKSYAGWLFMNGHSHPVHHCWIVYGSSVIDLSDDYTVMLGINGDKFAGASQNESRELVASFAEAASHIPNRERCYPIGCPTPFMFYVGAECDPDEARIVYQKLMAKYPDHECEANCNPYGLNQTQALLVERGVMQID